MSIKVSGLFHASQEEIRPRKEHRIVGGAYLAFDATRGDVSLLRVNLKRLVAGVGQFLSDEVVEPCCIGVGLPDTVFVGVPVLFMQRIAQVNEGCLPVLGDPQRQRIRSVLVRLLAKNNLDRCHTEQRLWVSEERGGYNKGTTTALLSIFIGRI